MDIKNKKDFLIRSLDSTNATSTTVGDSLNINPTLWEDGLRDYQERMTVLTPFAEQQDFTQPGSELLVTIDEEPDTANSVDEFDEPNVSKIDTRQVSHEPSEVAARYQLTKKQARRGFFDAVQNIIKKLGHKLALAKDSAAATELYTNATATDYAGGHSARVDLTEDDGLSVKTILKSRAKMQAQQYIPSVLFVTHAQEGQLLNEPGIQRANEFGGTEAIREGYVGTVFGINIVRSDSVEIVDDGAVSRAILLGVTQTGESAFGYGYKSTPVIEREYHAAGRYWDIVADEDYDMVAYHPKAIRVIESHNGEFAPDQS